MNIRLFEIEDLEAVVNLWQDCGLTVPWNDPVRDIERKLGSSPEGFLVGERDSQIIASMMVGYDGHRGWINYLAVSPKHRRQGLGEILMQHAEKLLFNQGCPKLNLQVRGSNSNVIEFYQALGYIEDNAVSFGKRLIKDD